MCNRSLFHLCLFLLLMFLYLLLHNYIHLLLLVFLLHYLLLMQLLLLRKFGFQLSLLYAIHCLYLSLSNLLCNLSHFSLCNRMYAHLFLLLFLCLHLLDLLYYIHQYQLHFLLQHLQMFYHLLLLHLQVLFLFFALCNILYNLGRFSLCNRSLLHFYLCPFQLLVFLCLLLCNCIHLLFLVFLLHFH